MIDEDAADGLVALPISTHALDRLISDGFNDSNEVGKPGDPRGLHERQRRSTRSVQAAEGFDGRLLLLDRESGSWTSWGTRATPSWPSSQAALTPSTSGEDG